MELCDEVFTKYMQSANFQKKIDMLIQLAETLYYLHIDMLQVHRDIKPLNLMV